MSIKIINDDALSALVQMPDQSVHCCVTSPPYYGLRDYGVKGQIGLEDTPSEYVAKMVAIFQQVRRVMREDGTLWLNLGDSYNGYMANQRGTGLEIERQQSRKYVEPGFGLRDKTLKNKDLIGIPWRVAFALQEDGWYLRQDIIWHKPNPMPESVTDRCTKAHEYIFLLTKSERYYYDAEAIKEQADKGAAGSRFDTGKTSEHQLGRASSSERSESAQRNKRSVWTVATAPYKEAHFATFPPDLIKPCILAGSSIITCAKCGAPHERQVANGAPDLAHQRLCGGDKNGEYNGKATKDYASSKAQDASATKARILAGMVAKITTGWKATCDCNQGTKPATVLDPFAGSGTTGAVAIELGRHATMIELNPKYIELISHRCMTTPGLAIA